MIRAGITPYRVLYRVIEYEPGAVIYRPPGEGHSHEFGEENMAAIVIERETAPKSSAGLRQLIDKNL
jgi:hypothetical protein